MEQFNSLYDMLEKIRKGALVILQSNNYFAIEDHINCHNSVKEFNQTLHLEKILYNQLDFIINMEKYQNRLLNFL